MTAKEAREKGEQFSRDLIEKCNKMIESESIKGATYVNFPLPSTNRDRHTRNLTWYFKERGFSVSMHDTYDQDYTVTGKYLWIRWDVI